MLYQIIFDSTKIRTASYFLFKFFCLFYPKNYPRFLSYITNIEDFYFS
ncbi:hypothetical protein BBUCA112A_D0003 (plasmid) [Borreliella burgdorferi CA-11.2A]|nr:hypothetical protein BBU72A_D0005 [Borreliella burgdorferi 72a]ACN56199.1 hypothetical protein BBUCA112A_D0003 [Borreliella burgdorferi CA-11.2A]